jgi:hypothetical protein
MVQYTLRARLVASSLMGEKRVSEGIIDMPGAGATPNLYRLSMGMSIILMGYNLLLSFSSNTARS